MTSEQLQHLENIKRYLRVRDEKPLRALTDSVHGIHSGTEWEAEIKLSDLRAMLALIDELCELKRATEDAALDRRFE